MSFSIASLDTRLPYMGDRFNTWPDLLDAKPVPLQDLPVALRMEIGESAGELELQSIDGD